MLSTVRCTGRLMRSRPGWVAATVAAGTAIVAGVFTAGAPGAAGVATHAAALAASVVTTGQWPVAGQNLNDTHFQAAEHKISPASVTTLAPKWTLTTTGNVAATPTVYDGVVYASDMGGTLWAVDASSGQPLWSHPIASYTGVPGDLSRTSPAAYNDEIITGDGWVVGPNTGGARVFAVNSQNGKLLWSTKVDSFAASIITSSPVVYGGVAYLGISSNEELLTAQPGYQCCVFRGAVVALNAGTGQILWKTYTLPSNNNGSDTNLPGYYSGNSVWGSSPVIDPVRGLLYIGTGNNYTVPAGVCTAPGQTGCTAPAADDYVDSILALNLDNGAVAWADHTLTSDEFTVAAPFGPDFDFGTAPNLFTTTNPVTGLPEQLLGIGQKSGFYWAVDPRTGKVAWSTQVGPGGVAGGIEWGSATDGRHVYVAEADSNHLSYTLGGSGPYAGQTTTGGSWAALDAATGKIIWQTPDPQTAVDLGFVSAANGVVYAGSNAGTGQNMYALDAATGNILWGFASGGAVISGAAVVNGTVYWGSGYYNSTCPAGVTFCGFNDKLYAFAPS
jgi:polyvinyl alcohol dehydrogenase (cytochrome)